MFLPTLYVNHVKQSPGGEVGAVCTPGQEAVFCFLQIFFFLMWTILKVFIEFVPTLLVFYVLVFWHRSMLDLSSLTSDQTHILCIAKWNLNHWVTREVPSALSLC